MQILTQTHDIPQGVPLPKPFDPREQTVESLTRAIRAAQAEQAAAEQDVPELHDRLYASARREQLQRLADQDTLRDLIRKYGIDRIQAWGRNLAAQEQWLSEQAQGEEIQ